MYVSNLIKHLKDHWLKYATGGFLAVCWSWLPFVKIASTSPSLTLGRSMASIAFIVIWGISFVIFWPLVRYVAAVKITRGWILLRIVLTWAFVEYAVSWLVTIIWLGQDGSLDSVLPFGSLTPLLSHTPLGYIARLAGYHGLSALGIVALMVIIRKDLHRYRPWVLGGIVCLSITGWALFARADGTTVTATITAEYFARSPRVPLRTSQLVVLPEYGLNRYTAATMRDRIAGDGTAAFVGSRQYFREEGIRNTLVYGTLDQGFLLEKDKTRLIPGGEYLPYLVDWSFQYKSDSRQLLDLFNRRQAIAKGSDKLAPIKMSEGVWLGSAVCSSIISTRDYRQLAQQGATIFTNSAALDVFSGSRLFSIQHKGLAKFMAIANTRPFLQSSSDGAAFAIDHNGRVLKELQPVGSDEVTVSTNSRKTPYIHLGEWPVFLGGILLGVNGIQYVKHRYHSGRQHKKASK